VQSGCIYNGSVQPGRRGPAHLSFSVQGWSRGFLPLRHFAAHLPILAAAGDEVKQWRIGELARRRRSQFGVWGGERLTDGGGQWWHFLGGRGHRWEAGGRVEVEAGEVGERHAGEAKLIDGSAVTGNHRRRMAPERHSQWTKNSASATLASRRLMAHGWLLPWGGSWVHEGGGSGFLDTEACRWRPVVGTTRRLVGQRWSTVEEQSEAHFAWASEKRRRLRLALSYVGIRTSGARGRRHKVAGGGRATAASPYVRGRALAGRCGYSASGGWQVGPRLPLI
jgi:hypothetical protein